MGQYRKKPVVIEAFKWTGGPDQTEDPEWIVEAIKEGIVTFTSNVYNACIMHIETLEGVMTAKPGDWIIRGIAEEIYPCKPEIFGNSYEAIS